MPGRSGFAEPIEQEAGLEILKRWKANSTPIALNYARNGGQIALIMLVRVERVTGYNVWLTGHGSRFCFPVSGSEFEYGPTMRIPPTGKEEYVLALHAYLEGGDLVLMIEDTSKLPPLKNARAAGRALSKSKAGKREKKQLAPLG